ncbi:MAG TPA: GNAT family protein [Steroidobacteraceae bacterium]|nr:GNAT family protein [Steroidobacteraceae bacterium]
MPILTARLVLREFVPGDLADLERLAGDRRAREHAPSPSRAVATVQGLASKGPARLPRRRRSFEFAVVLRRGGKLIGACDLALTGPGRGDIGYLLAPRHWGFGYGTEVVSGLVDFAFTVLGLKELTAVVAIENDRSRRVLDKAGLRWDGLMRRHARFAGRWWDCHRYIVDRATWKARNPSCG